MHENGKVVYHKLKDNPERRATNPRHKMLLERFGGFRRKKRPITPANNPGRLDEGY